MSERETASRTEATRHRGVRGPEDDFFCHKYDVWYRVEDCVFRVRNRTYPGCVSCFQGHFNNRCLERGEAPPVSLSPGSTAGEASAPPDSPPPPGRRGSIVPFVLQQRGR